MSTPRKVFVSISVVALLLGCDFLTDLMGGGAPTESPPPPPSDTPAVVLSPTETFEPPLLSDTPSAIPTPLPSISAPLRPPGWPCYDDDWGFGFTICYPPEAILTESPPGMARIDLPIVEGTNLRGKWVDIVVIRGAPTCPTSTTPGRHSQENVWINGLEFTRARGGDAGVGNVWEWVEYSTAWGDTCVRLTFVLHSGNPMMYDPPIPEFDPEAESAIFDAILATFMWWG